MLKNLIALAYDLNPRTLDRPTVNRTGLTGK
jgi:hypothetical protein